VSSLVGDCHVIKHSYVALFGSIDCIQLAARIKRLHSPGSRGGVEGFGWRRWKCLSYLTNHI
jgi:hypothetical protein